MDAAAIEGVRRFSRVVTQRVGALDDDYLARRRPLGEARVLWEVGADGDGCDLRRLRSRLGLDSGYLSRLLRSLEADGLVTVGPSDHDRRIRTARLTPAGRAERALLDEGSDELAASLLAPLTDDQRRRLVTAMGEVERLLTAAQVVVAPADPAGADARYCLRRYFADIDGRFPTGFDEVRSLPLDADQLRPPAGELLVASLGGEPVGCGGVKFLDGGVAEVKRMWVSPAARGLGLARRLLAGLEARAVAAGATQARLDTNATLTEAINLYRSSGYVEVEPFNDEPYAQHWFVKPLT